MADLKISELDDGGASRPTDQVVVVREGDNVKATVAGMADVIDEAYTAVNGDDLLADTSAGAFTINVPAAGEAGMKFRITDATDSFGTHTLTVGKNGQTIMGLDENFTISSNGASLEFYHNGTTWRFR